MEVNPRFLLAQIQLFLVPPRNRSRKFTMESLLFTFLAAWFSMRRCNWRTQRSRTRLPSGSRRGVNWVCGGLMLRFWSNTVGVW